jgi:hypothetical protein
MARDDADGDLRNVCWKLDTQVMRETLTRRYRGTFWKSIGDAMNISYEDLPSHKGWKDGLHWFEELEVWSTRYEMRCMVPDKFNKITADETTSLLLYDVPEAAKPAGKVVVTALMEARLRKAMMYPAPPAWVQWLVDGGLNARKLVLRYLALPRPVFLKKDVIAEKPAADGRNHLLNYDADPW